MDNKTILFDQCADWTGSLWQRPHHLARYFADHGWKVYFVNSTKEIGKAKVEVEPNIFVYYNKDVFKKRVKEVDVHFISWSAKHSEIGEPRSKIVVHDDLDGFPEWASYLPKMVEKSNLICCASMPLFEERIKTHDNVVLARNACDFELMQKELKKPIMPREIEYVRKNFPNHKIVIFSGAIGSWVDNSILEAIAAKNTKYAMLFVGLPFGKEIPKGAINVGRKTHAELMSYMLFSDVAVLPFDQSPISINSCPIKTYEYLAAGLKVVSTDIPESRIFPDDLVLISKTNKPKDFIKAIDEAIRTTTDHSRARAVECVRNRTWKETGAIILEAIEMTLELKDQSAYLGQNGKDHLTIKKVQETIACMNPHGYYDTYKRYEISYWEAIATWISSRAKAYKINKCLDLGIAYGTLAVYTHFQSGCQIYGVDFMKYISDLLVKTFKIDYSLRNIEFDDLPNEEFDIIIFTEILEHLSFNVVPTLQKIANRLSETGVLYLSTPDASSPGWGKLARYKSWKDMPNLDKKDEIEILDTHIYQFDLKELEEIFDLVGLKVNKLAYTYSDVPANKMRHFNFELVRKETF